MVLQEYLIIFLLTLCQLSICCVIAASQFYFGTVLALPILDSFLASFGLPLHDWMKPEGELNFQGFSPETGYSLENPLSSIHLVNLDSQVNRNKAVFRLQEIVPPNIMVQNSTSRASEFNAIAGGFSPNLNLIHINIKCMSSSPNINLIHNFISTSSGCLLRNSERSTSILFIVKVKL